jgi:lipopolysaccharide/colanic/teichoic acid biosynthesis glycosyltransferase
MPSRTLLRARPAPAHPSASSEALVTSSHGVAVGTPPVSGARAAHHANASLATQVAELPYTAPRAEPRPVARPSLESAAVVGHLPRVSPWQAVAKRTLDVVGSALGLAVAAPLLVVLALAIRADSGGRVLFVQRRVGRYGRAFSCYKLRTMCVDAEARLNGDRTLRAKYEANGYKLPVDCDPRVTRFGRFLRATSLDELPQLWNVLRGDMSLVGPRPVVPEELAHYGAARELLLSVRPGITGAWAVQGRSSVNYPERADIELTYVRSWTVAEDLRILVRTVGAVLQQHGAH